RHTHLGRGVVEETRRTEDLRWSLARGACRCCDCAVAKIQNRGIDYDQQHAGAQGGRVYDHRALRLRASRRGDETDSQGRIGLIAVQHRGGKQWLDRLNSKRKGEKTPAARPCANLRRETSCRRSSTAGKR